MAAATLVGSAIEPPTGARLPTSARDAFWTVASLNLHPGFLNRLMSDRAKLESSRGRSAFGASLCRLCLEDGKGLTARGPKREIYLSGMIDVTAPTPLIALLPNEKTVAPPTLRILVESPKTVAPFKTKELGAVTLSSKAVLKSIWPLVTMAALVAPPAPATLMPPALLLIAVSTTNARAPAVPTRLTPLPVK